MIGIDVLILEEASASAVGTTIDVVSAANRIMSNPVYDIRFVSKESSVQIRGGISIACTPMTKAKPRELVIIPGLGMAEAKEIEERIRNEDVELASQWLRKADALGSTIGSSCTGVFLLAASGLLSSKKCVTTWWLGMELKSVANDAIVMIDEMVVRDERIWTAGSAFAHIDLMLALVRHFSGSTLADELANRLVIDHRTSQAGFLIPSHLAIRDPKIANLERRLRNNIAQPHTLASMASWSGLGTRTLARRTQKAVGLTPHQLLQRVRLERGLHLLRTSSSPIENIATEVGLSDPTALFRLIKKHTGQSPGAFRPKQIGT